MRKSPQVKLTEQTCIQVVYIWKQMQLIYQGIFYHSITLHNNNCKKNFKKIYKI